VDHPELYVLPAPAKKNIDIMVNLKAHVTADDVQPLSDWLVNGGFRIVDGSEKSGYLHLSGSVGNAEDAFQTQIMMTQGDRTETYPIRKSQRDSRAWFNRLAG
jgi:hypothetical protein